MLTQLRLVLCLKAESVRVEISPAFLGCWGTDIKTPAEGQAKVRLGGICSIAENKIPRVGRCLLC